METQDVSSTPSLPDGIPLLRLALEDAKRCASDPDKFQLDMARWFIIKEGKCHVCVAGALLAQTLKLESVDWDDFRLRHPGLERKLHWINDVRVFSNWVFPDVDIDEEKIRTGDLAEWEGFVSQLENESS
ncbi:MAG: hypothetical protein O3B41_11740 [Bacteroidetes bacterium]|nr:hypothetical protein [Bacteroidota bacterium]